MAAYPSITIAHSSRVIPRMGVKYDTAVDGTYRGVALHTVESYDITIDHQYISSTDASTIESFWASNKYIVFTLTWRGTTYNCYFASKPHVYPAEGDRWHVQCKIIGTQSGGG